MRISGGLPYYIPVTHRALATIPFVLALAAEPAGGRVEYLGGTLPGLRAKADGRLELTGRESLLFHVKGTTVTIPYNKINILEYGQRVNRRYIEAVVISPLLLLAKSRKHYLTLGYADAEGVQQSVVFRIDKDDVRTVLSALEARSGRKVEYTDEDARKNRKG